MLLNVRCLAANKQTVQKTSIPTTFSMQLKLLYSCTIAYSASKLSNWSYCIAWIEVKHTSEN